MPYVPMFFFFYLSQYKKYLRFYVTFIPPSSFTPCYTHSYTSSILYFPYTHNQSHLIPPRLYVLFCCLSQYKKYTFLCHFLPPSSFHPCYTHSYTSSIIFVFPHTQPISSNSTSYVFFCYPSQYKIISVSMSLLYHRHLSVSLQHTYT